MHAHAHKSMCGCLFALLDVSYQKHHLRSRGERRSCISSICGRMLVLCCIHTLHSSTGPPHQRGRPSGAHQHDVPRTKLTTRMAGPCGGFRNQNHSLSQSAAFVTYSYGHFLLLYSSLVFVSVPPPVFSKRRYSI